MDLFLRAKNILLQPSQEWPAIAAEPADTKSLFLQYPAVLGAVGGLDLPKLEAMKDAGVQK
jgi:hypothetical protein